MSGYHPYAHEELGNDYESIIINDVREFTKYLPMTALGDGTGRGERGGVVALLCFWFTFGHICPQKAKAVAIGPTGRL